jgi:hypothetical protein
MVIASRIATKGVAHIGPHFGVVRIIFLPLATQSGRALAGFGLFFHTSIGRGSSHVRSIHKPLAFITNLLSEKHD